MTATLDLQPGDTVRVKGLRGEFRLTAWRQERSGLVANIIGGTSGHRMFRSVPAERLQVPRRDRRSGAGHGR